ncbi:hypothetical protein [Candidatus Magnetomonas plexicatena]|uniref:hypothetical protein n=1 Tax=Candidatus Magnetomonas plexicatena TaxID=2552947 RepID=UPI0011040F82|nr:hypothetical protein E2O03_007550 [Nitrospirales bacterium LBB_01]
MIVDEESKVPCPARMAIEWLESAFTNWSKEKAEQKSCWQVIGCPFNIRCKCPAFVNRAGRRCWLVAGTMGENPFCTHLTKLKDCTECSFYIEIKCIKEQDK